MKTPVEKCDCFLDAVPLEFTYEFEEKYCPGNKYYGYLKFDPEGFVRDVVKFSFSHKDNQLFQSCAQHHLGPEMNREENILGKKTAVIQEIQNQGENNSQEPVQKKTKAAQNPRLMDKPGRKKYIIPEKNYTEADLQGSICEKLFTGPRSHSRYGRLSDPEKRYILKNAGFTKREREVFKAKCGEDPYSKIAEKLGISVPTVKLAAVNIDHLIANLIND